MAFRRGEVVLVPSAGLRFPSALKPAIFTLDPTRVIHRVGALSATDQAQVDQRLRQALAL